MTDRNPHGGDVIAAARTMGARPDQLLDFSANINPLGPPPGAVRAASGALDLAVHYPDPFGRELTDKLASVHGLDPAQILVGNGSTQLIYLAVRALRPRKALLIAPCFFEYERALIAAGVPFDAHPAPESSGFILKQTPDLQGADLVFIANPGNPAGSLIPPDRLASMVRELTDAGAVVVLDEAFIDFAEEASQKALVREVDRLIVLRSFTKIFALPGLRLGFAAADRDLTRRLTEQIEPWSVNTPAQAAGLACLGDQDYLDRTRSYVDAARTSLAGALSRIPGLKVFPSAANYLLVKIDRAGWTAAGLKERLAARRILIRDAGNFRGLDQRFFRVAVRTDGENRELLAALADVWDGAE
jgi:threonine-phosphate decarboxylase